MSSFAKNWQLLIISEFYFNENLRTEIAQSDKQHVGPVFQTLHVHISQGKQFLNLNSF